MPPFRIVANTAHDPNFNNSAVFVMQNGANCALHSVGVLADNSSANYNTGTYDAVQALGLSDLIDGHSYISGGRTNVYAAGPADLQVYDSSLNNAWCTGLYMQKSNVKISRNSIAGAGTALKGTNFSSICIPSSGGLNGSGADDVYFSGQDALISSNIIQQSLGWGVEVNGPGRTVRLSENYFDDNGKWVTGTGLSNPAGAIWLRGGASDISLCANTFTRNGPGNEQSNPSAPTAHIYLSGALDTVSLCGNAYSPGQDLGDANIGTVSPDYTYNAAPGATLTNITIADNPAPQNIGVISPNATPLLASAINPQNSPATLHGLVMSNDSVATKVDIASGSAVDSTGAATINLPNGCTVNLNQNGLGGLDVGSVASNTTYYFFAVASAGGTNASCMASASQTPAFINATGPYAMSSQATTLSGSPFLTNTGGPQDGIVTPVTINPLAGMAANDIVTDSDSYLPACTTNVSTCAKISALNAFFLQTTGSIAASSDCIGSLGSVSNVAAGMPVGDGTPGGQYIPQPNYVVAVNSGCTGVSPPYVEISSAPTAAYSGKVVFGGNFTVTLNTNASGSTTTSQDQITVYGGLYRTIGVLYTTSASNVVPFAQDGDTFYLNAPASDINAIISFPPVPLTLPSVPSASGVEAFGRCVATAAAAGNKVHIFTPGLSTAVASAFPASPGFDTQSTAAGGPDTSFPYRAYTDGSRHIEASASTTGTTLQCMTDGWDWKRSQ